MVGQTDLCPADAANYAKMIGQIEVFSPKSEPKAPQRESKTQWSSDEFARL